MYVEEFAVELDELGSRFASSPLTGTLEKCYATIIDGEREMFAEQTGPDGLPWVPRQERLESHPLLNRSGTLLAAATGGSGHIKRIGDRELITGVQKGTEGSLAGARIHQLGGTIRAVRAEFLSFRLNGKWVRTKQVTIPARPFIGANSATITKLYDVVSEGVLAEVFHRG
jgi:phage gpG-like protein